MKQIHSTTTFEFKGMVFYKRRVYYSPMKYINVITRTPNQIRRKVA